MMNFLVSHLPLAAVKDGVAWHDITCGHRKPVICQESAELVDFALGSSRAGARKRG